MELLGAFGWQGIVLLAWLGLCIGSFLNVVIYRVPVMLQRDWRQQAQEILSEEDQQTVPSPEQAGRFNLLVPRSRCPQCEQEIRPWHNIPVIGWLWLRGRCANCNVRIPFRYPGVELLTGLMTVAVIALYGFTPYGFAACIATWMLIALTFIDYDTQLLPDQITLPLLWLGLLTNVVIGGVVPLQAAVIGAVAGYLSLWSVYWGFKLLTGKEGMGYGDFKLLAALGAWFGWQTLPGILVIAAALGLLFAIARMVQARVAKGDPIPFGPFLAAAGWVTLMFRDTVLGLFLPA